METFNTHFNLSLHLLLLLLLFEIQDVLLSILKLVGKKVPKIRVQQVTKISTLSKIDVHINELSKNETTNTTRNFACCYTPIVTF